MAEDDPLEQLSSKELHDRAVRRALKHLDVKFFWRLLEVLPAAEAAAGEIGDAAADIEIARAHLDDLTDAGRGQTAQNLRAFYLEDLPQHRVLEPATLV